MKSQRPVGSWPYINKLHVQLEQEVREHINDPNVLQEILAELLFRNRKSAVALRNRLRDQLEQLSRKAFLWPSTAVTESGKGLSGDHFYFEHGLLSFMGYRVGYEGVKHSNRRDILDYVFCETLPRVVSTEYMQEWGEPRTAKRLRKLANCLATFCRRAKKRPLADMSSAILDWEADLSYLKSKYYSPFNFKWPDS
jgi:hypothetical protein